MSDAAISGTRRSMKEMADGTIRVQIDIDPIHRDRFFKLFPEIDKPVALAPLVSDFEERQPEQEKPKGGKLSQDAARICQARDFQIFVCDLSGGHTESELEATMFMRKWCGVDSRAELDHNEVAGERFARLMGQYRGWMERRAR